MSTAVLVSLRAYGIASSRLPLVERLHQHGWKVVVAAAPDEHAERLRAAGARFESVQFQRGGLSPWADLRAWRQLKALLGRHQPSLLHNFNAKPNVLATDAARRVLKLDVKIVNTITGLGFGFSRSSWSRRAAKLGYGRSMQRSDRVVFQNQSDMELFLAEAWVQPQQCHRIVGSGVDTGRFRPAARPPGARPRVLMVSRLLRQKGVGDFLYLGKSLRERAVEVECVLGGERELEHPDAFPLSEIEAAAAQSDVRFEGYVQDMPGALDAADLIVVPSRYREGVPRFILEAAASGRPVVAYDEPGAREAIVDGVTGALVDTGDRAALVARVVELLGDPDRRRAMGGAARALALEKFSLAQIIEQQLSIYRELGCWI